MNSFARPFKKILRENLMEFFSLKFLLLPLAIALIKSFDANDYLSTFVKHVFDFLTWIYASAIFLADAFLRALYWYARERKPSYIKKMREQDEWMAAKEAKNHQSVDTDPVRTQEKGNST